MEQDRAQHKIDEQVNAARLSDAKLRLEDLQDKVSKLQTQAQTAELSKQLLEVKRQLAEAEARLQGPRAKFAATFATKYYQDMPVVFSNGERVPEGIKFKFGILNQSDTAARNVLVVLQLCDACSFASEPPNFERAKESPDSERVRNIPDVAEHSVVQDMEAIVIVPPLSPSFKVALLIKCDNCDHANPQLLTVNIPAIVPPDFHTPAKSKPKF